MTAYLRELLSYRELFINLTVRDLLVRYKRSALGFAWARIEPLSQMLVYTVVFSMLLRIDTPNYPLFVLCGLLPWALFFSGITYSLRSISDNAPLIKKVYFRREMLPLSCVAGRLVHFAMSLLLLLPLMLYYDVPLRLSLAWLPLIIMIQLLHVAGIAVCLAALNTLYDDIFFITNFVLSALFYLTPVFYPVSMVPPDYRAVYMLNPMAALIRSYRAVVLDGGTPPFELWISALTGVMVIGLGGFVFRRLDPRFAEVL